MLAELKRRGAQGRCKNAWQKLSAAALGKERRGATAEKKRKTEEQRRSAGKEGPRRQSDTEPRFLDAKTGDLLF